MSDWLEQVRTAMDGEGAVEELHSILGTHTLPPEWHDVSDYITEQLLNANDAGGYDLTPGNFVRPAILLGILVGHRLAHTTEASTPQ